MSSKKWCRCFREEYRILWKNDDSKYCFVFYVSNRFDFFLVEEVGIIIIFVYFRGD